MAFSNSYSKTDTCIEIEDFGNFVFALEKQIEHERHKIREDHKEKILQEFAKQKKLEHEKHELLEDIIGKRLQDDIVNECNMRERQIHNVVLFITILCLLWVS